MDLFSWAKKVNVIIITNFSNLGRLLPDISQPKQSSDSFTFPVIVFHN